MTRQKLSNAKAAWKRIAESKGLHHAETLVHLVYYSALLFKFENVHEFACIALVLILIPLVTDLNA